MFQCSWLRALYPICADVDAERLLESSDIIIKEAKTNSSFIMTSGSEYYMMILYRDFLPVFILMFGMLKNYTEKAGMARDTKALHLI